MKGSADYTITLIRPDEVFFIGEDLQVRVLYAKHNDILSDRDSVGFLFLYQDVALLYTGDTGFDQTMEQAYAKLKKGPLKRKKLVLLAHIGGFKPYETNYKMPEFNHGKAFCKNHLGRLESARLVEILSRSCASSRSLARSSPTAASGSRSYFKNAIPKHDFFPPISASVWTWACWSKQLSTCRPKNTFLLRITTLSRRMTYGSFPSKRMPPFGITSKGSMPPGWPKSNFKIRRAPERCGLFFCHFSSSSVRERPPAEAHALPLSA